MTDQQTAPKEDWTYEELRSEAEDRYHLPVSLLSE